MYLAPCRFGFEATNLCHSSAKSAKVVVGANATHQEYQELRRSGIEYAHSHGSANRVAAIGLAVGARGTHSMLMYVVGYIGYIR